MGEHAITHKGIAGGKTRRKVFTRTNVVLYLMFLAPLASYAVFHYLPLVGIAIAFADFRTSGFRGWVGFKNFETIFRLPFFWRAFANTWVFVLLRYLFTFPTPIILALLLNELRLRRFKKSVQTITTLPHFISWVVVAGIWHSLLSPTTGYVNEIIKALGGKPFFFLSKAGLFPPLLTGIMVWKEIGYSAIIYLAALAGVNPELYESAYIDGAGRLRQTWSITLPSIKNIVLVVFVLSFSGVLNLFEPCYVFMNSHISRTADVLDTYTYSLGIVQAKYPLATAVGLFKSTISLVFVIVANAASKRLTEDRRGII